MSTDDEIRTTWKRIEGWLAANVPPLAKALRPPAAPDLIARAETKLGVTFPAEMRASFSVHDGQSKSQFEVFGNWELLPIDRMVQIWEMLCGIAATGALSERDDPEYVLIEGPVRPRRWDRRWIPFAKSGTGDYLLLDLDPPPEGRAGQVVSYEKSSTFRAVVAPDVGRWLVGIAESLETGQFEISPEGDQLLGRDD